jgi:hypothetical protein
MRRVTIWIWIPKQRCCSICLIWRTLVECLCSWITLSLTFLLCIFTSRCSLSSSQPRWLCYARRQLYLLQSRFRPPLYFILVKVRFLPDAKTKIIATAGKKCHISVFSENGTKWLFLPLNIMSNSIWQSYWEADGRYDCQGIFNLLWTLGFHMLSHMNVVRTHNTCCIDFIYWPYLMKSSRAISRVRCT